MRVTWLALAVLVTAAGVLLGQGPPVPLVLLATVGDYPGETYTAGPAPPAEFVFFTGEPIAIDVSVANWGGDAASLRLPTDGPAIHVEAWRDGLSASTGTVLEAMWRDTIERSHRTEMSPVMTIDPGDALRWRVMLETRALEPGFYLVRAQATATGDGGEPVRARRSEFTLEIRSRAEALPAELARRTAEWLTAEGDAVNARAAVEALERVYPDSVAVHLIRGRLADAEGDDTTARREMAIAAAFMRSDRDGLFRRFARPGQIEDLVDSLRP